MKRRQFLTTGAVAVGGLALIPLEGCSFATAIADLEAYLPVGLQAFAGIVDIINPLAGSALETLVVAVPKVWAAITVAINNYKAAGATGTLSGVIAALEAGESAITAVFGALSGLVTVPATDLQAAQAALLLMETTLAAIQAKMGTTAPIAAPAAHVALPTVRNVGAIQIDVAGKPSGKYFKQTFNAIMAAANHNERKL